MQPPPVVSYLRDILGKKLFLHPAENAYLFAEFRFFSGKMGYILIDHHEVKLSIPHVPTGKNDLHLQKSV